MLARLLLISIFIACVSCSSAPSEKVHSRTNADMSSVGGDWLLTIESPMGREAVAASFSQMGERVTGTLNSSGRDVPIEGRMKGNELQFEMSLDVRGHPLQLDYVGIVEGDTMSGTVQFGPIGQGKFSGTRKGN